MWYQIIGLFLDIIGVIFLSMSGILKVSGRFQYGSTKDDYIMLYLARVGILLVILGFIFQIVGVIVSNIN